MMTMDNDDDDYKGNVNPVRITVCVKRSGVPPDLSIHTRWDYGIA